MRQAFRKPGFWVFLIVVSTGLMFCGDESDTQVPARSFAIEPDAEVSQWTPAPTLPDQAIEARALVLARVCAHEVMYISRDWTEPFADCWGINQVITNRARALGTTWHSMARRYSGCSLRACPGDRNPWTHDLNAEGREPLYWPAGVSWGYRARDRWLRLLAHARAIVTGQAPTPCDGSPDHWGSKSPTVPDFERAQRAIAAGRWTEVRCRNALNGFYRERRRDRNN